METSSERSAHEVEPATGAPITSNRKRVSRACDECRLHKSRCDGTTSCATCSQTGRVCSYSLLPSDTKGPNAKIRILQRRLFRAQQVIQDLQKQVPGHDIADEYTHRDPTPEPTSTIADSAFTAVPSVSRSHGVDCGKDIAFKHTLTHSLLRSVSNNDDIIFLLTSATAHFTVPNPVGSQGPANQTFCQLAPYPTMLEIVYAAFSNVFALCTVVPEQDFRVRTQRLYDVNPIAHQPDDTVFMPLFFAVIALGMVYSSDIHPNLGYRQVLQESESYSRAAMAVISTDHEYTSVVHLQITLCRVLHLLNTSRLDLARDTLQLVCKSSMVQQLIRSVSTDEPEHIDFSDCSSRSIVWTIFYLDMLISGLLGAPYFLSKPGPEMATVFAINTAIYNVANNRRSENAFLLSVSVAMAIELMKLIQSMPYDLGGTKSPSSQQSVKGKAAVQDSSTRDELRTHCETWEALLQAAFAEDDCNPTFLMIRRQLQMHLYLAQITLHHLSLGNLSQAVPWHHVPRADEFKEEDACIRAAVDAVTYTLSHLKQDQTNMISWLSAYITFISIVTLLISVTSMNHSNRRSIQRSIDSAKLILSNTTYGSWHAKSCYLHFAQKLSNILSSIPTSASTMVRRSSFSSDTSTLVASSEARTPFTTHRTPSSSHTPLYRTPDLEFRRLLTSNDEDTNPKSEWGFD